MRSGAIPTLALSGLTLLHVGGCASPPERLGSPDALNLVHDAFKSADLERVRSDAPDTTCAWWYTIGGHELETLLVRVQISNRSIRAGDFRAAAARYIARRTEAERRPEATLDASATGTSTRARSSALGTTTSESSSESYSLGAGLRWELDLWGRLARLSEASNADAEAQAADVQALRLVVIEDAATQWILQATAREQIDLLARQASAIDTQIDVLAGRQQLGEPVLSQIQQLRSIRSTLDQDAAVLELEVERAQYRMLELSGLPMNTEPSWVPTVGPELDWHAALGSPMDLLGRRPDLQAALDRLRATDARAHAAFLERWPKLELSASASFTSTQFADLFLGELLRAAVQLSAPLYDGGRRRAREQESLAHRDAASEELAADILRVMAEVETAIAGVDRFAEAEAASLESIAFARNASEESRARFIRAGGSALDALVAEERLLQTERQSAQIRRSRALAVVRLGIALGHAPPVPDNQQTENEL